MKTQKNDLDGSPHNTTDTTTRQALRKGDRVTVYNSTLSGKPVVEGKATIMAVYPQQSRAKVHFDGDPKDETYLRFVDPANKIATSHLNNSIPNTAQQ